jgi:hypothetical protein
LSGEVYLHCFSVLKMEDPEIHSNIKWIPLSITAEYPEGIVFVIFAFSNLFSQYLIELTILLHR